MRAQEGAAWAVAIEDDVAVLVWRDVPAPATTEQAVAAIKALEGYRRGMPMLMMDQGADLDAPTEYLRQYARQFALWSGDFGGFAFVATSCLNYGLARIVSAYAEALGVSVLVTSSKSEAMAALRAGSVRKGACMDESRPEAADYLS